MTAERVYVDPTVCPGSHGLLPGSTRPRDGVAGYCGFAMNPW